MQVLTLQVLWDHSTEEPRGCAPTKNMENQSNPSEQWMKRIRKYRVGEIMNPLRSWLKLQNFQRGLNYAMQSSQEGTMRSQERSSESNHTKGCWKLGWSYRHRQRHWWERQDQGEEKDLIKTDWKNKAKDQLLYLLWKHLKSGATFHVSTSAKVRMTSNQIKDTLSKLCFSS